MYPSYLDHYYFVPSSIENDYPTIFDERQLGSFMPQTPPGSPWDQPPGHGPASRPPWEQSPGQPWEHPPGHGPAGRPPWEHPPGHGPTGRPPWEHPSGHGPVGRPPWEHPPGHDPTGRPPWGHPPFTPPGHGHKDGPPTSPPPSFVPPQQVQTYAVDPGGIARCLYKYTYVWLRGYEQFWFYPVFVGRTSIAGYRWTGHRWIYFGVDLRQIQSFTCY